MILIVLGTSRIVNCGNALSRSNERIQIQSPHGRISMAGEDLFCQSHPPPLRGFCSSDSGIGRVSACQGLNFANVIMKRPPLSDFAFRPTLNFRIDEALDQFGLSCARDEKGSLDERLKAARQIRHKIYENALNRVFEFDSCPGLCQNFFGCVFTEQPEQRGMNEKIQQGRADQSPQNHSGHRIEDFFSRFTGSHG